MRSMPDPVPPERSEAVLLTYLREAETSRAATGGIGAKKGQGSRPTPEDVRILQAAVRGPSREYHLLLEPLPGSRSPRGYRAATRKEENIRRFSRVKRISLQVRTEPQTRSKQCLVDW